MTQAFFWVSALVGSGGRIRNDPSMRFRTDERSAIASLPPNITHVLTFTAKIAIPPVNSCWRNQACDIGPFFSFAHS